MHWLCGTPLFLLGKLDLELLPILLWQNWSETKHVRMIEQSGMLKCSVALPPSRAMKLTVISYAHLFTQGDSHQEIGRQAPSSISVGNLDVGYSCVSNFGTQPIPGSRCESFSQCKKRFQGHFFRTKTRISSAYPCLSSALHAMPVFQRDLCLVGCLQPWKQTIQLEARATQILLLTWLLSCVAVTPKDISHPHWSPTKNFLETPSQGNHNLIPKLGRSASNLLTAYHAASDGDTLEVHTFKGAVVVEKRCGTCSLKLKYLQEV